MASVSSREPISEQWRSYYFAATSSVQSAAYPLEIWAAGLVRRTVSDLPYDVLFELCGYLSAVDFSNLLSTCRSLHKYHRNSAIWQRLSARYGLRDISYFRGLSYHTIYTKLLHPYGPLLGLWASDHPYRGNILEFRLSDSGEQPIGIIGEAWQLSDEQCQDEYPLFPEYTRVITIAFAAPANGGHEPGAEPIVSPDAVHITCNPSSLQPHDTNEGKADQHSLSLEIVPSTHQGHFLQGYRRTFLHPDFPAENSVWFDSDREFPSLLQSTWRPVDQRELVRIFPAVRLPVIFAAPTPALKPPALAIHCPARDCADVFRPFIPFDDLTPPPTRYYPLRRHIQTGVDPASTEWTLTSLTGLWLGAYGQYGTECLYLAWVEEAEELCAWKLTGDVTVPRGCPSWTLQVNSEKRYPPSVATWLGMEPTTERVFSGVGIISERGFPKETYVDLIIGITAADEIKIWWDQINDLRVYLRYKGRELECPRTPT